MDELSIAIVINSKKEGKAAFGLRLILAVWKLETIDLFEPVHKVYDRLANFRNVGYVVKESEIGECACVRVCVRERREREREKKQFWEKLMNFVFVFFGPKCCATS